MTHNETNFTAGWLTLMRVKFLWGLVNALRKAGHAEHRAEALHREHHSEPTAGNERVVGMTPSCWKPRHGIWGAPVTWGEPGWSAYKESDSSQRGLHTFHLAHPTNPTVLIPKKQELCLHLCPAPCYPYALHPESLASSVEPTSLPQRDLQVKGKMPPTQLFLRFWLLLRFLK